MNEIKSNMRSPNISYEKTGLGYQLQLPSQLFFL